MISYVLISLLFIPNPLLSKTICIPWRHQEMRTLWIEGWSLDRIVLLIIFLARGIIGFHRLSLNILWKSRKLGLRSDSSMRRSIISTWWDDEIKFPLHLRVATVTLHFYSLVIIKIADYDSANKFFLITEIFQII